MSQVLTRKATQNVSVQGRVGALVSATIDDAANTVNAIFSAGARVARSDWMTDTRYEQELAVNAAAGDFSRIEAGVVQVLDSHDVYAAFVASECTG